MTVAQERECAQIEQRLLDQRIEHKLICAKLQQTIVPDPPAEFDKHRTAIRSESSQSKRVRVVPGISENSGGPVDVSTNTGVLGNASSEPTSPAASPTRSPIPNL